MSASLVGSEMCIRDSSPPPPPPPPRLVGLASTRMGAKWGIRISDTLSCFECLLRPPRAAARPSLSPSSQPAKTGQASCRE
eukprot:14668903-Alexandrium_andersonii.AAC.1